MPKDTFFNLLQEKQLRILDISVEEFYQQGYEKASISRIVDTAGIAKGSFYQYFEGKEDLFRYIVQLARKSSSSTPASCWRCCSWEAWPS